MLSVIGAGAWGSALFSAFRAVDKGVLISSRTKRDISGFVSLDEALNSDFLVFSIAAQKLREFLTAISVATSLKNKKILIASKGIETATGCFMYEVLDEFAPNKNVAFLSGPSFAKEVALNLPCALVISSQNAELADLWAKKFPPFIKTYTSSDVAGAEICGAYKNVIAIAAGVCAGLNLGQNARASLIARGLVEMERFGSFFGAKSETFLGLSGAGDLFLTASSELSRNYRVGLGLAKNSAIGEILNSLGEVAEGVATSEAITKIARKNGIYTPIANEVNELINGKNALDSLKSLLKRG